MTPQTTAIQKQAEILFQQGFAAHRQGKTAQAAQRYEQALKLWANHAPAWHMLGVIAAQSGRFDVAVQYIGRAASLMPQDYSVHNNLGNALHKLERNDLALQALDRAHSLKPDAPEVLNNRGNALLALGRFREALQSYDQALALVPEYVEALTNSALAYNRLYAPEPALQRLDRALAVQADYAPALAAKAHALVMLNRVDEAAELTDAVLAQRPSHPEALYVKGLLLTHQSRWAESAEAFQNAIAHSPRMVQAYADLAVALANLKRHDEALDAVEKAIANGVRRDNLLGARGLLKTGVCDWSHIDQELRELLDAIEANEVASLPFHILGVVDDLDVHQRVARIYTARRRPADERLGPLRNPPTQRPNKLKIGYFSADFCDHATTRLMADFFECHDKALFECVAFSYSPRTGDAMQQRIQRAFDQFIDINDMSDEQVASLARQMELDIAIDLKGFTGGCRPGIFAFRAAPIQVNYLGFPGTMGASYIDYILADAEVIPDAHFGFYDEKVVQLPHTYQVNDRQRQVDPQALSRADVGLPETGFVFACFNNNYKIQPPTFAVWMRILKAVPGSVLWLLEDNAKAAQNLRMEAERAGVDANRLVFAPRRPLPYHLARHRLADLFLDTLPYNAHTTTSDALWAGLPVLTQRGKGFAARVAASLLKAAELPELITDDATAYEAAAIGYANAPQKLLALRDRLRARRDALPLFDTPRLTRDIERAYELMYQRWSQGLAPDHIYAADF